jgi:hypothetical protein
MRKLIAAPAVWALHFLACYAAAAIACEKAGQPARGALVAATVLALAALAVLGRRGYRRRADFLGRASLWLSALTAVAVVYEAGAMLAYGGCR